MKFWASFCFEDYRLAFVHFYLRRYTFQKNSLKGSAKVAESQHADQSQRCCCNLTLVFVCMPNRFNNFGKLNFATFLCHYHNF